MTTNWSITMSSLLSGVDLESTCFLLDAMLARLHPYGNTQALSEQVDAAQWRVISTLTDERLAQLKSLSIFREENHGQRFQLLAFLSMLDIVVFLPPPLANPS